MKKEKENKKQKSGNNTSKKSKNNNLEFGEDLETEYGKEN